MVALNVGTCTSVRHVVVSVGKGRENVGKGLNETGFIEADRWTTQSLVSFRM